MINPIIKPLSATLFSTMMGSVWCQSQPKDTGLTTDTWPTFGPTYYDESNEAKWYPYLGAFSIVCLITTVITIKQIYDNYRYYQNPPQPQQQPGFFNQTPVLAASTSIDIEAGDVKTPNERTRLLQ